MPKVASPQQRLYGPLARGFGSRIRTAVQRFASKAEAAQAMGLSTDAVNTMINEGAVPNFASMAALALKSGVKLDYLAFDRDGEPEPSTGKSFSAGDDTVLLRWLDGVGSLPFPRVMLTNNYDQLSEDQLGVLKAPGNAMEPTIKRHSLLVVDRRSTRIGDGEIFVFDFSGDRVVRRTQREPDGSLMLHPDNKTFESMRLTAQEATKARVLGRVIWMGSEI